MTAAIIVTDRDVLGGKAHIAGTRISVEFLLELMAGGASQQEVLEAYPQVTEEALSAALRYAAGALQQEFTWDVSVSA